YSLPLPSYEATFRTLSIRVRPATPLTGNAGEDAPRILAAISAGHVHTAVDAIAAGAMFEFTGETTSGPRNKGDSVDSAGAVTLRVRSNVPSDFSVRVYNGTDLLATHSGEQQFSMPVSSTGNAAFWVAIAAADGRPWLVSNPIYVGRRVATDSAPPPPPSSS